MAMFHVGYGPVFENRVVEPPPLALWSVAVFNVALVKVTSDSIFRTSAAIQCRRDLNETLQ